MKRGDERLGIGQVAERTGLAVSAIRYYEERGLVTPVRNIGGQRRFRRSDIRRLSFVMIAQQLGMPLDDIAARLASLPEQRTPTKADWKRISNEMRSDLQQRIDTLTRMRDKLDGCIGCGCLSLSNCALYNRDDAAAAAGAGPRFLLGDSPL